MTADDGHWTFQRVSREELRLGELARACALAEMSYSTAPDFYDLIPASHERLLELIADQLGMPGTETSDLHVLARNHEDVALVAALSSGKVDRAKQDSTLAIVRSLDRAGRTEYMASLSGYTATVEPFDVDSFYLTRIAVAACARRSGAGAEAMRRFVDLGAGRPLSLHVKADNIPAISLYKKFGFQFVSDDPFRFRAMLRNE